jgi:hypothetical protein
LCILRNLALLHLGQISTARSTQLPLSIVGRPTNLGPPQTSFHMMSFFRRRFKGGNIDVSNVARPTFQTWQVRRFKRGKTDISNVASETFQTWQDRHFKRGIHFHKCGKRDVPVENVARPNVLTWQLRHTSSQTWQERRSSGKRGKRDVLVENVARETLTWQDRC